MEVASSGSRNPAARPNATTFLFQALRRRPAREAGVVTLLGSMTRTLNPTVSIGWVVAPRRLTGGVPVGERRPIGEGDPNKLIQSVLDRVRALIDRFDDPATPYLAEPVPRWAPRFSDYRHLERVAAREDEE